MIIFLGSIWVAFIVGILVGWIWRPRRGVSSLQGGGGGGGEGRSKFDTYVSKMGNSSLPLSPSRSLPPSPVKGFGSAPCLLNVFKMKAAPCIGGGLDADYGMGKIASVSLPQATIEKADCSMPQLMGEASLVVKEEDLEHLIKLVEMKDGGPSWTPMMDRYTPSLSYQASCRDPETGPPQYRSITVYEDATPEMVRDFFWDDEFRLKWDDMLTHSATIKECPSTGTMVVHWVRKFPLFCSDREYTIGRRIWTAGDTYYCVTKGVPCPSVPRKKKPLRVDLYYSSWCIRPVASRRGSGQNTACEVILFHHEDMAIPWEIAKFGVRQGMWGAVKKIDSGFRAYQKERALGASLSPHALLAHVNTKIKREFLPSFENLEDSSEIIVKAVEPDKVAGSNIPKLLVIGGAFILACSLDRGLLSKAVIFGVGRKLANLGQRMPNH